MKSSFYRIGCIVLCTSLLGCAKLAEIPKVIWGSSTKALEESRDRGVSKNYACNLELCFEDILDIAQKEKLKVFIKDKKKGLIVLMGFKESVDTTEVGIFFTAIGSKETRLEIVSISDAAQGSAVALIFSALNKIYLPEGN